LKGNVGLFVAGVDGVVVEVVPNALTGVDVIPNALPFVNGLGPGLEASWLGAADEKMPCEVPVFADGKAAFRSDPPTGLLPKLNSG